MTKQKQLTFSQEASHANLSPLPGSEKARQMTVTSGQKCLELYRKQSPVGLLVRMLLESSIWDSKLRFLTWKEKVTKWNYSYFQLAVSAVGTKGTGSGLLQIFPTPTARDHKDTGENVNYEKIAKKHRLVGVVQMMPTPNACSGNNSGRLDEWGGKGNPFRGTQEGRGQLNPNWVTWLMGYPPNWVDLE